MQALNRTSAKSVMITAIFLVINALNCQAQYSDGPYLRLNTWMHTGGITQIAVSKDGRHLVSSSYDRTVRLWDIKSRYAIATFRPPIGRGEEGILLSVSISGDGQTIVTAGRTRAGSNDDYSIYVFNVPQRALVERLKGNKDAIYFMTFSPDDKFLAVLMGPKGGLRIYRTETWEVVQEDFGYEDIAFSAIFNKEGQLATTSMDGHIRVYAAHTFERINNVKITRHNEPFGIAYAADGKSLAVGYTDSLDVSLLSAPGLMEQRVLRPTNDSASGTFAVVAWSADGNHLYAAGEYRKGSEWMIRHWPDGGKGKPRDIPVGHNTITDLRPLPSGEIAFSTLEPSIGFLSINGKVSYVREGPNQLKHGQADFRGNIDQFLVSHTGDEVRFPYDPGSKDFGQFSISHRTLMNHDLSTARELKPSLHAGLAITGWQDKERPELDGKLLDIEKHEVSRSLSISPQKDFFILGTERHIYCFQGNGSPKWKIRTDSIAWGVNISGDAKVVLAALSDGTIHWYRSTDGQEILTLFPHPDRQRWILWNSDWYYDVSQGAEDLIGWHLNRGWDAAADFFPMQLFRGTYYRPDLTAEALLKSGAIFEPNGNGRSAPALAAAYALEKTPPVVKVLFPAADRKVETNTLVIKVAVRSLLPIVSWQASINGRPVVTPPPVKDRQGIADGEVWRILVTIPEKDSSVSIIASHQYFDSVPASVPLKWIGPIKGVKGNLNILAIGVSSFNDSTIPRLKYADKDAKDFVKALTRQKGIQYSEIKIRLLTDKQANYRDIEMGLQWLTKVATPEDITVLFLAGHGLSRDRDVYNFLPYDYDPMSPEETAITARMLLHHTQRIESANVIVILDTCHADDLFGEPYDPSIGFTYLTNTILNPRYGGVVMSSVSGKQLAGEEPQNGFFSGELVKGIRGAAANDGEVTVEALGAYVAQKVKRRTGGLQIPMTWKPRAIPDFVIARKTTAPN